MKVLLFGIAREIVGERMVEVAPGVQLRDVSSLKRWITETYPAFNSVSSFAVAVDNEFANDNDSIEGRHEVAIIPPVSGG
jgi:molybdopterin synthase sulfur carrier subunit